MVHVMALPVLQLLHNSHHFVGNPSFNGVVSFLSFKWTARTDLSVSKFCTVPSGLGIVSGELQNDKFTERRSPKEVSQEIQKCYDLIHRLGRGVVYLGSSRIMEGHPHYTQAFELGKQIAELLECTSWSGAGPGLMDAATKGALQAGKPVAGLKIGREAGEWATTNIHSYLPIETYITCRFFSARKHGLVDAAVRTDISDRTAIVALPGGVGTFDEVFEILALIQLGRIGSKFPIPFLLMNYDSFYSKLIDFLGDCMKWGTLSPGELDPFWKVCSDNVEAVSYLAEFYQIPRSCMSTHRDVDEKSY